MSFPSCILPVNILNLIGGSRALAVGSVAAAEGLESGGLTLGGEFSIIVATCLKKRESKGEKNLARPFGGQGS